jgi:hypothetical protein
MGIYIPRSGQIPLIHRRKLRNIREFLYSLATALLPEEHKSFGATLLQLFVRHLFPSLSFFLRSGLQRHSTTSSAPSRNGIFSTRRCHPALPRLRPARPSRRHALAAPAPAATRPHLQRLASATPPCPDRALLAPASDAHQPCRPRPDRAPLLAPAPAAPLPFVAAFVLLMVLVPTVSSFTEALINLRYSKPFVSKKYIFFHFF